jgi:predicted nucleic acid-binding protein
VVVIDASVLVEYFSAGTREPEAREVLGRDDLLAPHLIDAEVGHALRRLVAQGELEAEEAEGSLSELDGLRLGRSPHGFLLELAWGMRARLTFYDALYVALAAAMDAELVTVDRGMARAANSLGVRVRSL